MNMNQRMVDCASPLTANDIVAFRNDGIFAFGRYLNPGWKQLSHIEKDLILEHGCKIVSIFESNGNHLYYFTEAQGEADARLAQSIANALGQPHGTPIFFCVDTQTQTASDMDKVRAYFAGIYKVLTDYKVGVYGSAFTLNNVHADFYFQTYAWSAGIVSSRSCIYQFKNGVVEHNHSVDEDKIGGGYWPVDVADVPNPVPVIHVVHPVLQLTTPYTTGGNVKLLQMALSHHGVPCTADGVFGNGTKNAVMQFQRTHNLTSDGVVGPKTWAALGI